MIRIVVRGTPAPQGSKSFKGMSKAGRAVLVESSKKVRPWRQDVKLAAETWREQSCAPTIDGPLRVRMVFTLPKPKSAPKTRRTYPDRKPDVSKLARSTEDALTDAGVWADDARVVWYSRLAKVYPGEDPEALDSPGVVIVIEPIEAIAQPQQAELSMLERETEDLWSRPSRPSLDASSAYSSMLLSMLVRTNKR